ncbi:hypothetical protein A3K48_01010 [candidate division WOR-1 bacterium RIFOXYA12_FULL_52_29]|uniref:Four helix bundle protein n=1 Tax=candidate division WOR-1 bacterium RIFOXYC12_FULL_54_18 TaxID=1802584 RepID=A0A1F4T525_UNCSA|nr:MAG: hypothetical protein A3K44_01010 [candidate division WOR-1 bacterium RIFOXYA2_FULL_51_19]OGC17172.1 MAG: hypothetical protein A3K48_01010 [candidate division WOR-1 bacterium RIFOXYA12_FULL_52_29]OGC26032.1 MAG: hypothetical protein A3K32_01005 [candidate division WOR-1 bacterium RIFOXYB2_FULL_45_9]OGC27589.1 MAG: hypothetical protein A3K49_01010 [candidate division WOR-1 bacterium RIFOXYC12_FULL_54_18]OGC29197.1 MAG: hypothetical protein A2346_00695 [candidate division WOR-1 bacterium R
MLGNRVAGKRARAKEKAKTRAGQRAKEKAKARAEQRAKEKAKARAGRWWERRLEEEDMEERLKAHQKMIVWKNLDQIEKTIYTTIIPAIPKNKFNLRDQMDRAASSSMANFIEGYYSGSLKEYLRFLGYSRRSLAELRYWARHSFFLGYIKNNENANFDDLSSKTMYLLNRLITALKNKL